MHQSTRHSQQIIAYISVFSLCAGLLCAWTRLHLDLSGPPVTVRYSIYSVDRRIHCLQAAGAEQATAQQQQELGVLQAGQQSDFTGRRVISDFRSLRGSGRDALLLADFQVPKVIHQIWAGDDASQKQINSWQVDYCKICRGWSHRLWTPADLQGLVGTSQLHQLNTSQGIWHGETSALFEHGGVVIPAQLKWDGRQCLDGLLLLARTTGAVVTMLNGTVTSHTVVAAIKQHPFVRQWASMGVVVADKAVDNLRSATLNAALQIVDNSRHSPHCTGGSLAASYFSAWEPALTSSLVSTAYVPSNMLFVPQKGVLQQGKKRVAEAENALCSKSSNTTSFVSVTCCDVSTTRAHVVASHCKEDLQIFQQRFARLLSVPAVSQLRPCLFIYSKCGQAQQVREGMPGSVQVLELANIAREGHTYLTHITNYYDSMPERLIFLQAGVEEIDGVVNHLTTLKQTSGFLSLGGWRRTGLHYNELPYFKGTLVRLAELYSWLHQDLVPDVVDLTYRGQFAVTGSRVLAHPRSFYIKLLKYLTVPVTHFTAKDYRYIQPPLPEPTADTQMNDPLFGHVLERSWGFIFGCGPTRDKPQVDDGLTCA